MNLCEKVHGNHISGSADIVMSKPVSGKRFIHMYKCF